MPPKRKTISKNNSQAKLKYINTCIKNMIKSLPCQTFISFAPNDVQITAHCLGLNTEQIIQQNNLKRTSNSNSPKNTSNSCKSQPKRHQLSNNINNIQMNCEISSDNKIQLNECFLDVLPHHPNIFLQCSFCKKVISSIDNYTYIEQPQARKRYTPVCADCACI